ncbi:MAG: response regulator, partial [Chitinophagia bacterium]|nr:response regulator [Chitinophagia bacterium]
MTPPVVLIVEDDNVARFVFKKLINKLNVTCFEAENGQEALSVIERHPEISHVFLDLNMPVMDGYGFLHIINSGDKHRDLNIYVTTISDKRDFNDTIGKYKYCYIIR